MRPINGLAGRRSSEHAAALIVPDRAFSLLALDACVVCRPWMTAGCAGGHISGLPQRTPGRIPVAFETGCATDRAMAGADAFSILRPAALDFEEGSRTRPIKRFSLCRDRRNRTD
jgi:hypothetical protein